MIYLHRTEMQSIDEQQIGGTSELVRRNWIRWGPSQLAIFCKKGKSVFIIFVGILLYVSSSIKRKKVHIHKKGIQRI